MKLTRRQIVTALPLAGMGWGGLARAKGKFRVVTTTEDLASLTREVGGEHVSAEAIARGYQDPHFVEPKPSFIMKLHRADLLILVGLQLEIGWLPPLMNQSRNAKIHSAQGYLDTSRFAEILQKPVGAVSRAMGDVHPLGNPHYHLDPNNGRRIAAAIRDKLTENMPDLTDYFRQRFQEFDAKLTKADRGWVEKMAPYHGRQVITYHQSWPNFAEHFGIEVAGYIEPLPGIPPTPKHTIALIQQMMSHKIKMIWYEPYFDSKTPEAIANAVGGEAVVMLPSVGGRKEVTDYFKLFDYDIGLVTSSFNRLDHQGS